MANNERTVSLNVKANDNFSSTFKKLEDAKKRAATRSALRDKIGKLTKEYKDLSAQLDRYSAAIGKGRVSNSLAANELIEIADAASLVRQRMRDSIGVIQQHNAALNKSAR